VRSRRGTAATGEKISTIAEGLRAAVVTHNFVGPELMITPVHLDVSIRSVVLQE
jgi:hypothetical protein